MSMRVTGMISGMDTESIISELVAAKQTKVDDLTKAQTKLQWKQDAWKELNSKIYKLYSSTLETLQWEGSYTKKTTSVSDSDAVSVTTADTAMDSIQTLKIKTLATSGYMTGSKIADDTTTDTTMKDLLGEDAFGTDGKATIKVQIGSGEATEIELTADSKISDVVTQLKAQGLNANFDASNGRFYIGSKESGTANDFTITAGEDELSGKLISALGLEVKPDGTGAVKQAATNAEIELNGMTYTSDKNVFEINGLTIECKQETGDNAITMTTKQDTSGIYDMIKKFITGYAEVVNEMDKLYNADSASGLEPLTDDEKDSMTDSEIEKYEEKVKAALLRRDSTLGTFNTAVQTIMATGIDVNGKNMTLSDFGIETLGYFVAADNEKHAYHINGDADDSNVSTETNKLQNMITTDPDTVVSFFTQLSRSLYGKMKELMGTSDYSSINTVYDDKQMKKDYADYTTKIAEQQEKVNDYEDKWYSKFSAMETALAKLQSNSSAVTSLLGG